MHPPFSPRRRPRRLLGPAAALALVAGALALAPSAASAAAARSWYVAPSGTATTCASNSKARSFATIQAAVTCAADGAVIQLAPSGSTPYPGIGTIRKDVTVKAAAGANARTVQIDVSQPAGPQPELPGALSVAAGNSVKVQGVTIECPASATCSGSLVTNNGTLALSGVTVTGSQLSAAITNLSTDSGSGPARLTITDSTIAHNTTEAIGAGGITNLNSPSGVASRLTVTDSTLADDNGQAGNDAGAIYTNAYQDGAVQLNGDTITGNRGTEAGGIEDAVGAGGTLTPIELENTIVAGNVANGVNVGPDCVGNLADLPGGHNLIGNVSECGGIVDRQDDDLVSVPNPELDALADNGGPTDTVALGLQSPVIGNGDPASCGSTDQRGDSRRVGVRGCDIGAYDTQGHLPAPHATWFVAPSGTGTACASNSKASPFGTIQAALACASSGDVIQLAPSGATPYPGVGTISQNLTIKAGPAANARTVKIDASRPAGMGSDGYSTGLLTVAAGSDVQVQGITIECSSTQCSGSPVTNHGDLSMSAVTVTGAQYGPGITNLSTDSGQGPARLMITDSTISGNTESAHFGDDHGAGGISNLDSPGSPTVQSQLTVKNSTLADNTATAGDDAGALYTDAFEDGAVQLIGDTITGNEGNGAGGLQETSGETPIELEDTILAGNTTRDPSPLQNAPDCLGRLGDLPGGHNLIGDDSQCAGLTSGSNADQTGTAQAPIDPRLAPVAFNGGSTETAPLLSGSPAIGAGDPGTCASAPLFNADQRGDSRNASVRKACDIGAFDTAGRTLTQTAPTITMPTSATGRQGKHLSVTVTATGSPTPALTESGQLPSGVTFVDSAGGSGQLAGTPASGTAGTYSVTITASNGVSRDAAGTLTLTVH